MADRRRVPGFWRRLPRAVVVYCRGAVVNVALVICLGWFVVNGGISGMRGMLTGGLPGVSESPESVLEPRSVARVPDPTPTVSGVALRLAGASDGEGDPEAVPARGADVIVSCRDAVGLCRFAYPGGFVVGDCDLDLGPCDDSL